MSIFLQSINYIVDAYLMFAASALAGNTFLRSLAGAGFPLFARQMFDSLGIQWASTLLGCVAVILIPIPFVFYFYGAKIRQRSAYAPTAPSPAAAAEVSSEETNGETPIDKEGDNVANLANAPRRADDPGVGNKETV